ncbi:hypothetical protein FGO68_gene15998 [Halteria grandinella]|uniref:Uncharacterized protein n=1 Tax=Halteria grandinella TaxID=5974 RepID=A0A8J8NDF9_HALGN|nr:hypothetical protein FGO68_gene15998 [Halteria grandinella]
MQINAAANFNQGGHDIQAHYQTVSSLYPQTLTVPLSEQVYQHSKFADLDHAQREHKMQHPRITQIQSGLIAQTTNVQNFSTSQYSHQIPANPYNIAQFPSSNYPESNQFKSYLGNQSDTMCSNQRDSYPYYSNYNTHQMRLMPPAISGQPLSLINSNNYAHQFGSSQNPISHQETNKKQNGQATASSYTNPYSHFQQPYQQGPRAPSQLHDPKCLAASQIHPQAPLHANPQQQAQKQDIQRGLNDSRYHYYQHHQPQVSEQHCHLMPTFQNSVWVENGGTNQLHYCSEQTSQDQRRYRFHDNSMKHFDDVSKSSQMHHEERLPSRCDNMMMVLAATGGDQFNQANQVHCANSYKTIQRSQNEGFAQYVATPNKIQSQKINAALSMQQVMNHYQTDYQPPQ